jgi:hypothetical protein
MSATNKTFFKNELIKYISEYKKFPELYEFVERIGKSGFDFHLEFETMEELREYVWLCMFEDTYARITASEEYALYAVREKMLAFYYTLLEELQTADQFVKNCFESRPFLQLKPQGIRLFDRAFNTYCEKLMNEGLESGELANRQIIGDKLSKILKAKLYFILDFRNKDTSENKEQTDAAVEKSVHLAFDLLEKNAMDTVVDFGKFFFGKTKV